MYLKSITRKIPVIIAMLAELTGKKGSRQSRYVHRSHPLALLFLVDYRFQYYDFV